MSGVLTTHHDLSAYTGLAALRDWMRLHAWSVRRRTGVAAVLALMAALSAGVACVAVDFVGVRAARSELHEAEHTLADAQRAVARLPVLKLSRRQAGSDVTYGNRKGSAADELRRISGLTSHAGLALSTLEPSGSGGAGAESFQAMKLVAQGSFSQVRAFLAGLSVQPELVVPDELTIKRHGERLSVAATLQVFDGLPPVQSGTTGSVSDRATFDPFANSVADVTGNGALRLTGVLQDRMGRIALIESASGTNAVQVGQMFEGARVERIETSRVILTSGGTTQTLTWAEEMK
ncbi:hypothetical protein [Paraburkholderia sp.]|uniref:hypothetical protein n=1 Tax=Paraburkholderia sp. TaxID=1926495 RepID=UPI0025F84D57|nr:hypothetical protein [Paraburkholderia sp.]